MNKILFFDLETTGFVIKGQPFDHPNQPHAMQLAGLLFEDGVEKLGICSYVKSDGWSCSAGAYEAHGISMMTCNEHGHPVREVVESFLELSKQADLVVAHNASFDLSVLAIEIARLGLPPLSKPVFCTMLNTTDICCLPKKRGSGYKWPKLVEAHEHFFGTGFEGQHDALADVRACARVFFAINPPSPTRREAAPSQLPSQSQPTTHVTLENRVEGSYTPPRGAAEGRLPPAQVPVLQGAPVL